MADMKNQESTAGWRQGKWSLEEEQYVELLIEEFKLGTLPLAEGTTLRYFLSKMVNCNPKRVSKKYENTNYNGKHKYEPSSAAMSLGETKRRRERLQEFERRFLAAAKRAAEEQKFDEYQLQKCVDESRARTTQVKTVASPAALDGFQDRLTAEIQSRMELSNQFSGSTNAANMSFTGMPAKGVSSSPRATSNPHFGGRNALDYISTVSRQQNNNRFASALSMPGQLASSDFEDPLAWQVRSQNQAAQRFSAAQRFMSEQGGIFDGQSMGSSGSDLPFPSSLKGNTKDNNRQVRSLQAGSSMGKMSPMEFASLEHRNRAVTELRHDVLANDLASRHQQMLRPQGGSAGLTMMTNLEMIDSIKRGHDDMLDSLRPNKRFR